MNHCQWAITKCADMRLDEPGTHSATGATDGWYRQQLRPGKDSGPVRFQSLLEARSCSIINMWFDILYFAKSSMLFRGFQTLKLQWFLLLFCQERIASLGGGVAKIKAVETGGNIKNPKLDDSKSLHKKCLFHQTSIKKLLFRVPGEDWHRTWNWWFGRWCSFPGVKTLRFHVSLPGN